MTPTWVSRESVLAIHADQLARHGGAPGIRDEARLDASLARPRQQLAYGRPSLFELAAAYAWGIANDHPFADGNKRTAFAVAATLLRLNGYTLEASAAEVVAVMVQLSAGQSSEAEMASWLQQHAHELKD